MIGYPIGNLLYLRYIITTVFFYTFFIISGYPIGNLLYACSGRYIINEVFYLFFNNSRFFSAFHVLSLSVCYCLTISDCRTEIMFEKETTIEKIKFPIFNFDIIHAILMI